MKKFLTALMIFFMCFTVGCNSTAMKQLPGEGQQLLGEQISVGDEGKTEGTEQTEQEQGQGTGQTDNPQNQSNTTVENTNKGEVKVHFINVGQADSILIQQGQNNMLIDAGNNADGELVCNYIKSQGISTLDYVVGTHPHEDHIGGLDNVINSFNVKNVYMPKKSATTQTYKDVLTSIKNKNLTIKAPNVREIIKLGQAEFTVMAPNKIYEDANNCSIVLKMKYGNNTALFTGDAEATSEMDMVKSGADLKCDVLKLGHHGSKTSTCSNFLDKVKPSFAVISVGKDNKYNHPSQSTMDRLANVPVYRTDENGTIIMTSDGNNINFSCNPGTHNGKKESSTTSSSNSSKSATNTTTNTTTQKKEPTVTTTTPNNKGQMVWKSATGKKYHSISNCGKMDPKKAKQITLEEAKKTLEPCSKCMN